MPAISLPSYTITVARGSLERVGTAIAEVAHAHRYAIIADADVARLYGARVQRALSPRPVETFAFEPGERSKTRESWARLTDDMLASGFGRDSAIIALGGGVTGDLAGFVAATFLRGIPYVQIPTTLLAMIDSSIGGKTGVDTPAGKNLVGAFHPPAAVVIDPDVLATLPREHLRAGMAEAIKHGVIADAEYFAEVTARAPSLIDAIRDPNPAMDSLIVRSVEIKAEVVRGDERERGRRQVLNFGHTIGHAIERVTGYRLLHGEAVAAGMVLEAELAERAGIANRGTADRVREAVDAVGLPTKRPADADPDRLVQATRGDKKARSGATRYALPTRIGAMAGETEGWSVRVEDALVREVLA